MFSFEFKPVQIEEDNSYLASVSKEVNPELPVHLIGENNVEQGWGRYSRRQRQIKRILKQLWSTSNPINCGKLVLTTHIMVRQVLDTQGDKD